MSSSSGAGGAGPSLCGGVALSPNLDLLGPPLEAAFNPVLAPSGDGSGVVGIVYRASIPGDDFSATLLHVDFEPWMAWPSTLGPSNVAVPDMVPSFAAAPSPFGQGESVLYAFDILGMEFEPQVPTGQDGLGQTVMLPGMAGMAAILSISGKRALLGYSQHTITLPSSDMLYELALAPADLLGPGAVKIGAETHVGCSVGRPPSAAAPAGAGWILAIGSGQPQGDPKGCFGGEPVDLPTELQVSTVSKDLGLTAGFADKDPGRAIRAVRVTPRPDGAWVAWGREAGIGPAIIDYARVDGAGKLVMGPLAAPTPSSDPSPGSLAAASLGNDFVLAWASAPPPGRIDLQIIHSNGELGPSASIDGVGDVLGPMDLVASPAGDAVVLAWTRAASGDAPARVRLARLSCAP
jgi:hypothetical protein